MIQTVKLAKLVASEINVRKAGDDLIEQFAADISARGILQNLIVTSVKKPRGAFAVIAGSRRHRALLLLAERGEIDAVTYDVPVLLLNGDESQLSEASLAENFHHLAMSPADECRAFQHFLGQNGDIDAVAKRFGITRRFVEGRLRLANLAEPIFEALAAGRLTLDMAKAYASTESHERQMMVWNSHGTYGHYGADTIRRVIANESMKWSEPIARLVGEDAYVAAGGAIDRDLFSEDGDRWINPEIAQNLAAALMEAEARRIGEERGLAWIRPVAGTSTWDAARGLHRVSLPTEPLSEAEFARIGEIEDRIAVIQTEMADEELSDEAYEALDAENDFLADELAAISHHRPAILPPEIAPRVGLFLTLSREGAMELDETYYSETPLRVTMVDPEEVEGDEAGELGPDDDAGAQDGDAPDEQTGGEADGENTARAPRAPTFRIEEGAATTASGKSAEVDPDAAAPGGAAFSKVLSDQLAVQRRDVLGAAIVASPALALDYLLFVMADERSGQWFESGTSIRASRPQDPGLAENMPASRARDYLAEVREGLDAAWTEDDTKIGRFDAFRALDDEAKAAWLAWVVATSFEAKESGATRQNALQNRLATILEIDVASWWRPTSENFFDRVSKSALISLLDDVGGPALSGRHASQKKGDISASCEKLFAGDVVIEEEIKQKALAWVPAAMQFAQSAPEDPEAEDDLASLIEDALDGAGDGPDDGETGDGGEDLDIDGNDAGIGESDGGDESPHVFGDDDALSEWSEAAE
ncbi:MULTISPECIES: ParB/RepB/Spo0J family partition protein [unclassified Novosphingobium]|nr:MULTISPECIES: ParB/RepB/Spo0J family partition protein [unclassified Novosphingobium]MPS71392.1 ParB/RepB/Spo0J family partition protein [Novosphingobium sp.]TCM28121.1 ParB family chromosome partitioning protein [Novosphingobium sp. ST904]